MECWPGSLGIRLWGGFILHARRSPRLVPAHSVTVAVLDDGIPFAFGVATNISEGGACVQTGEVSTRRGIQVMLSFSNGEMLDASGRVV